MARMRIVELGSSDGKLLDRAVRGFRGVSGVDHLAFLTDPSSVCLLMVDGAEVVGWAWGTRQRHVCGYSQLQLYEIEVVEQSRRHGIGRTLLTAFLEIARRDGDAKVYLFTAADNTPAKALYREVGGVPAEPDETSFSWRLV